MLNSLNLLTHSLSSIFMTDYTLITKFRNKDQALFILNELQKMGKTCYNFFDLPADPNNTDSSPDAQMQVFESTEDFLHDEYYKQVFERDLHGLENAEKVIMLLPAGNSTHMEAGIARGLGKHLILIGKIEKPETLYFMFDEYYDTAEDFLQAI